MLTIHYLLYFFVVLCEVFSETFWLITVAQYTMQQQLQTMPSAHMLLCSTMIKWWCEYALLIYYYLCLQIQCNLMCGKLHIVCSNLSRENYFMMTHLSPDLYAARIPYNRYNLHKSDEHKVLTILHDLAGIRIFALAQQNCYENLVCFDSSTMRAHTISIHNSHNIFHFVSFYSFRSCQA